MLVPRGTEAGSRYEMFVMLSNYDMDRVSAKNVIIIKRKLFLILMGIKIGPCQNFILQSLKKLKIY